MSRPEIDDFSLPCGAEAVGLSLQTKEGPRGVARTQEADELASVTLIEGANIRESFAK